MKYAFILGRTQNTRLNEHDEVEYSDRYLIFKLIAARGKAPKITSFKHRFKDKNDMGLVEDINMAYSVSVLTAEDVAKDRIAQNGQKTKGPRKI